jgi:ribosomal protein S18 acetylase RimI-like enzyme
MFDGSFRHPGGMITLHELGPDEWRSWRELRLAALAEAPYAFGAALTDWQGPLDQENRWRERLSLPGATNLIAVLDGLAVGMATGVPTDTDHVVALISMWVTPAARGIGIGDSLLQAIAEWAHDRAADEVRLHVSEGNERAAALYLRNGYQFTGEVGDLMPDGVRRERVMAKRLGGR